MKRRQVKCFYTLVISFIGFNCTTAISSTPAKAEDIGCHTGVGTLDPMCPGGIMRRPQQNHGDTPIHSDEQINGDTQSNGGKFISNRLSGKCIDVAGAPGRANGTPLLLWNCETSKYNADNGSPTDQRWVLIDGGFIKNTLSGKCIDVSGDPGKTNGALLQLWDCETSGYSRGGNAPTDQRWEFTYEGFIKNQLSGKCVDVATASGTGNSGTPLMLKDCETGARNVGNGSPSNQLWDFLNPK